MRTRIPLEQYAGAVPDPVAVYRLPLLATLMGIGLLDSGVASFAAAAELREKALAKLLAAKAYVGADGLVSAEDEPAFAAAMTEFREIDAAAGKAQSTDDAIGTLDERLSWYTGKATGTPMRFERTQLDPSLALSPGRQFVRSEAYKRLAASGALDSADSRFRSDPVVVGPRMGAAASDIIHTAPGGGAAGLVTPFYQPGILELPQRPAVFRDLFANESMPSGDTISYAAQVGFDNAASAVAQAKTTSGINAAHGLKRQSSLAWERRTAQAEWIATWMATTRQALADESQTAGLIDNQGRLMIRLEEDDQLLNGNGSSPDISGIRDQVTLQTLDLTGVDNLDGVRTARRLVKTGLSRLDATFIALNPIDSEEFDLLKNLQGEYRGGNPIGGGGGLGDQPIWRLARVESEAVAEGSAIVGARAAATVYDRQPLTVLTADQHADFFVRNLVVILFEERLAFPIYFPSGFVEVWLADWGFGSGSGVAGSGGGLSGSGGL